MSLFNYSWLPGCYNKSADNAQLYQIINFSVACSDQGSM